MAKKLNLAGQEFGRLTVVKETSGRTASGCVVWLCLCSCGNESYVSATSLRSGHTMSCGCYQKQQSGQAAVKACTTHGMSGNPTYISWVNMRSRCYDKKNEKYMRYGGRGITVCDKWLNSFQSFLDSMGEKPTQEHQIDRADNDGNYEPGNCRWATGFQQQQNRSNSRWWYVDGVKYESSGHAARSLGINAGTVFRLCNSGKPGCYSEPKYRD